MRLGPGLGATAVIALLLINPVESPGQTWQQRDQYGWSLIQQRRYDEALAVYDEIVRANPAWDVAHDGLAACWKGKGDYEKALTEYNEAIRLNPQCARCYSNRSAIWITKNRYDVALSDANESVRLDPGDFASYSKRGDAWLKQNDYARALADFDVAIQVGNNVASSYRARAWLFATCPDAHFRDGKRAYADAVQAYQLSPIIIQLHEDPDGPYGPWSMRTLAAAYAECGDFKAAVEWEQKAVEKLSKDAQNTEWDVFALALYKSGKPYHAKPTAPATAVASTSAPTPSPPSSTSPPSVVAPPPPVEVGTRIVLKGAETPLRVEEKTVATGRTPTVYRVDRVNGSWLWVVAGPKKGWVQENDVVPLDRAAKFFADLVRDEPKAAWAYARRGAVWREKHEFENALADFTEAVRNDPDDAAAYAARAWVWSSSPEPKVRDGKRAVESARRACELTDWKDADALGALAAASAETGDFDAAVSWQEKALALFPKDDPNLTGDRARLALYKDKKPYRE